MKNLIIFLFLTLGFVSCRTDKYLLTPEQLKESPFSMRGHHIYINDTIQVATFTSMEWELYKGEIVQEISVSIDTAVDLEALIKYLHTRIPRSKIEVNFDKYKE